MLTKRALLARITKRVFPLFLLLIALTSTAKSTREETHWHPNFLQRLWKDFHQHLQQQHAETNPAASTKSSTQHLQHGYRRQELFEYSIQHWENRTSYENIFPEYSNVDRLTPLFAAFPPFPSSLITSTRERIERMFQHAYDNYIYNAWPAGELRPLSCQGGSFHLVKLPALTLIDALDTLILMRNYTEFARAIERLRTVNFLRQDQNVSLFEINIRVMGGLLSAHQLAEAYLPPVPWEQVFENEQQIYGSELLCDTHETLHGDVCRVNKKNTTSGKYWRYSGILLDWAKELGERLLPAFDTPTGIPYGTINLLYGVPKGETTVASLAGAGSLTLEFELLSRLTGDKRFGRAAKLATRALWIRRSKLDLLGKHINIETGGWTETSSGIGSNSDSFFEYLAKHYFLFKEDADMWIMLLTTYKGNFKDARLGEWYVDVDMAHGLKGNSRRVLESLMAFYPGLQVLLGEMSPAARSLNSFFLVREWLGFLPERFHFGTWKVDGGLGGAGAYPLRPELLESSYLLHRATQNDGWLWASLFAVDKIPLAQVQCGFCTIGHVQPETTGVLGSTTDFFDYSDEMPSFFLSETLKYLYLTFDPDNLLHQNDGKDWIFTTEAHPIHYVPMNRNIDGDVKLRKLRNILSNRIDGQNPSFRPQFLLDSEKWSSRTQQRQFHDNALNAVLNAVKQRQSIGPATSIHDLVDTLVSSESNTKDIFREINTKTNLAHLVLKTTGGGVELRRACFNHGASEWVWLRALTGGALDYADVYVSSVHDRVDDSRTRYSLLGSVEALGFYGSGTYLGLAKNDHMSCPLPRKDESLTNRPVDESTTKLSTSFGEFQVSAFPGGTGFYVLNTETDESIVASLLLDEIDQLGNPETFVMTYGSTPYEILGHEEGVSQQVADDAERTVVVSDFHANSYICEIKVIKELVDNGEETLLRTFPCAPAMFGPAHVARLAEYGNIMVEAPLRIANDENKFGCDTPTAKSSIWEGRDDIFYYMNTPKEETSCENSYISIVHRGECTFFSKSINQRIEWNAKGVIVINDIESELFIMSNSKDDEKYVSVLEQPVSVLITGEDGQDLVSALKRESHEDSLILARISLTKQQNPFSADDYGFIDWPLVSGSKDTLRILAKGGWGVQAKERPAVNGIEWQLQLFIHSFNIS